MSPSSNPAHLDPADPACGCREGAITATVALVAWPVWSVRSRARRQRGTVRAWLLYPVVVLGAALAGKAIGMGARSILARTKRNSDAPESAKLTSDNAGNLTHWLLSPDRRRVKQARGGVDRRGSMRPLSVPADRVVLERLPSGIVQQVRNGQRLGQGPRSRFGSE